MSQSLSRLEWIGWLCCFLAAPAVAQGVVYGTVSDVVTQETLPYANIFLDKGGFGATAGRDGRFRLVVETGKHTVKFSYVGYKSQSIDVFVAKKDSTRLDVALIPSALLMDEVTVVAQPAPLSTVHGSGAIAVAPQQIQNISGSFGDLLRALQAVVGITSNNEMSSQLSVRGGAAEENLILLDGVQLLEPFHLKDAPNTSLSAFNVALVKRIQFFPGGFPAQYGDRLSAVLDLEYREGKRERFAGRVDASLADAAITLEGPIARTGSALVSFRSTYSGYVARYLLDSDQRRPSFYDAQGKIGIDLSSRDHLSFQYLVMSDQTTGLSEGAYGSAFLSLQSRHTLSTSTVLHTALSTYRQDEAITRGGSISYGNVGDWTKSDYTISVQAARARVETQVDESYSIISGIGLEHYRYDLTREEFRRSADSFSSATGTLNRSSYKAGVYAENLLQLNRRLLVNAGLRLDYTALTGETAVSPRLRAAYRLDEVTTLKAAWGYYYQTPTYQQLLAASTQELPAQKLQKATHYILGVERKLQEHMNFRVEAYVKDLDNLISFERLRSGELVYAPRNDARGLVKGIDFEASFIDERVMGWINYGLMDAKEVNLFDGNGWHFRPTDQRTTISAVFEFRIEEKWTLNLRSFYGSGYAYVDNSPGTEEYTRWYYPEYKRIDVRVSRTFSIRSISSAVFLEITNLFSSRNVFSFKGTLQEDQQTPDYNLLLPMIINIGIRVEF